MNQEQAKKLLILNYSDTKLRNNYSETDVEALTSMRNQAFADEINTGNGDFIAALDRIRKYLRKQ